MEEFYRLSSCYDLSITEQQQAAKYISDLKNHIQECVILHDVFFIDEAHNKALKIERLQSRAPSFRRPMLIEESANGTGVQPSSAMVDRQPTHQLNNAPALAPATTTIAAAKSKKNPYAKFGVGKRYSCGKLGHEFNECPKSKQVNIADYEDDEEEGFEIEELNDSDFAEEHRELAACIVQTLLCNQKTPNTTQRHQIFYSKCQSKVCNLVINNESCKNIVSRALVDCLKLDTDHTLILTLLVGSRRAPLSR